MKRKWMNHGFTLIELLLVIFIIGILASAAMTTFGPKIRQGAWLAEARTNISRIRSAAAAYFNENSAYPADLPALVTARYLGETPEINWKYTLEPETVGGVEGCKVTAEKNKAPNAHSTVTIHANGTEDPPQWKTP